MPRTARAICARVARAGLAALFLFATAPPVPVPAFAAGTSPSAMTLTATAPASGQLAIDYPGGFTSATPARLKAAGVGIVIRYVADKKWKSMTKSEANALRKAGLDIAVVYESKANWMLGGRSAGITAAKKAKASVIACGGPQTPFIWFACDFATTKYSTINACLAGAASVLGADHVGVYGSYAVCDNALSSGYATKAWQTEGWSYGKVLPRCAIFQPAHRNYGNLHLDYDTDFVRAEDIGQWGYVQPGSTWSALSSPTTATLTSVRFANASTGVAVGASGTVVRTTDGGTTWAAEAPSTPQTLSAVAFCTDATGASVGTSGTALGTADGGGSWAARSTLTSAALSGVTFAGSGSATGWAVGSGGTILRTGDGGSSWTTQSVPSSAALRAVDFASANIGWAVGEGGTVLRTANGGTTWVAQSTPTSATLNAVHFSDASNGWAVGQGGTILRTGNGGSTWKMQSSLTTAALNSVTLVDAMSGWVAGASGTVLRTVDGGSTWVKQACPTVATLNSVYSADGTTAWIVGEAGTMMRATATGGSSYGSIYGAVTDAKSGKAIGGASVTLGSQLQAPTASDGSFVICRAIPGTYYLTFSNSRYITHTNTSVKVGVGLRSALSDKLTAKTSTAVSVPLVTPAPLRGQPTTVSVTLLPSAAATSAVTKLTGWHLEQKVVKKKVKGKTRKVKVSYWRARFTSAMAVGAAGGLVARPVLAAGRWRVQAVFPSAATYLASSSATVAFKIN